MASQFIGLHMRVVLRDPVGYQLTGTVRDVEAGSSLTLTNVFVAGTKDWAPEMRIDAANIADLSEIKPEERPIHHEQTATPVRQHQPPLQDPAILSLGRPPASTVVGATELQSSPVADAELEEGGVPGRLRGNHVVRGVNKPLTPIQDVAESLDRLHVGKGASKENIQPAETEEEKTHKRRRRRQNNRARQHQQQQNQQHQELQSDGASSTGGNVPSSGRGKGWRQTPMLQSTASFQPFNSLKRRGRGRKGGDADNGWESADVTEEMGDFDFENNLLKFDKRTIFDQMRRDDEVDDASRLVAYNRRPKPGTNNGKNLHYSENVLEVPPTAIAKNADFWNSEADEGLRDAERLTGRESRAATSMRRTESKNGTSRRSQSRKASGPLIGGHPLSRVSSTQAHQPGLYLVPSNRRVEPISTLQMLNLENIAANELGFTEDLMSENAGRGIAEVAIKALSDPAMKVRFELATSSSSVEALLDSSTTVVLAGNNKSSIRALAAARHLRNRSIDVLVCMVGIERERDLLEDLRRQIELYRGFGGRVLSKNEFFEYLQKNAATGARVPISLIIDAMLGLTISFEEMRIGDQATVYELMEWANRNEAFVLSVDVPSGIDPTSGKIAIIDGGPLFVKPRYVVSIGAPKRGLVEAVTPPRDDEPEPLGYAGDEDDWRLFIADMGLGSSVWKKAGTKIRRGIDFGGNWVLEMQYRAYGLGSGEL